MKFHEHVDTTYPKINYKLQLLTRQTTRDMAHTKPQNGSNSESRWGASNRLGIIGLISIRGSVEQVEREAKEIILRRTTEPTRIILESTLTRYRKGRRLAIGKGYMTRDN
jgi:hypothetical protein